MYTSNEIATNWLSQTGNDSPTQEEITSARTQLDNMRKLTLLRLRRY